MRWMRILAVVAMLAAGVAWGDGNRPAALVGDWTIDGYVNLFLFKDGTGLLGSYSITSWKVESKRLVLFMGSSGEIFDYKILGAYLTLVSVKDNSRMIFTTKAFAEEQRRKAAQKQYVTDSRDGHKYRVVKISGKTWMVENLNIETANSYCYDDDNFNCNKYGRLYTWEAAKMACLNGWHLPSSADWADVDTDDLGISALPGGYRFSDGSFGNVGSDGGWWTATEYNASNAYGHSDRMGEYNYDKGIAFSVRCVQD